MVEFHERSTPEQRIRIRPNRALTDRQALGLAALVGLGGLLVAAVAAVNGCWLSLPFAGAETLALVWATLWVRRRLDRVEMIEIGPADFAFTRLAGSKRTREVFPTGWVRIELRPGPYRWYPQQLVVSARGRELEVGSFLADRERVLLARRLRELTRPHSAWATP